MKSSVDLESRLARTQARKILAQLLAESAPVTPSGHCKQRMKEHNLIMPDIMRGVPLILAGTRLPVVPMICSVKSLPDSISVRIPF